MPVMLSYAQQDGHDPQHSGRSQRQGAPWHSEKMKTQPKMPFLRGDLAAPTPLGAVREWSPVPRRDPSVHWKLSNLFSFGRESCPGLLCPECAWPCANVPLDTHSTHRTVWPGPPPPSTYETSKAYGEGNSQEASHCILSRETFCFWSTLAEC